MQPRVLVLRAPGTNCDEETAHAFRLAGGAPENMHINRVLESPRLLADFQVFCIPGGFSYGDDVAAGRIFGNQIHRRLSDALAEFREAGKLVFGICNGFQVLLKTNLLAAPDASGPTATLAQNQSGHFEGRWVRLAVSGKKCVFLSGIEQMELPVAHGEGRFVTRDTATFECMERDGQLVLRYEALGTRGLGLPNSPVPSPQSQVLYPDNPNGAMGDVAGMCDATGRVFGLMPHPERFVDVTHHPRWTREERTTADGLRVFQNAVRYFL